MGEWEERERAKRRDENGRMTMILDAKEKRIGKERKMREVTVNREGISWSREADDFH